MSEILLKIDTEKSIFVPSDLKVEFEHGNNTIKGEFKTYSRIDNCPIFIFDSNDFDVNIDVEDIKLVDNEISNVLFIQPMEDNSLGFVDWQSKMKDIMELLGYTLYDVLDNDKFIQIKRDLKLKILTNEND